MPANPKADPQVHRILLAEANVPLKFRHRRLAELHTTPAVLAGFHFLDTFLDHYVAPEREWDTYPADPDDIGRGLFLAGPAGTGKTTLAALIAVEHYWRGGKAYLPFFTTMADLVDNHKAGMSKERTEEVADANAYVDKAQDTPLLVLDDVGKEHRGASGWADSVLRVLLRHRYDRSRPTIITTNIPRRDWAEDVAMVSFIDRAFVRVAMDKPDFG